MLHITYIHAYVKDIS